MFQGCICVFVLHFSVIFCAVFMRGFCFWVGFFVVCLFVVVWGFFVGFFCWGGGGGGGDVRSTPRYGIFLFFCFGSCEFIYLS